MFLYNLQKIFTLEANTIVLINLTRDIKRCKDAAFLFFEEQNDKKDKNIYSLKKSKLEHLPSQVSRISIKITAYWYQYMDGQIAKGTEEHKC